MKRFKNEDQRLEKLDSELFKTFAHLDPYSVDIFTEYYTEVVNDMIEITEVDAESCSAIHLFYDTIFQKVHFREAIQPYLKAGDVFLVTMGLLDGEWYILHSSLHYDSFEWEVGDADDEDPSLDVPVNDSRKSSEP